ncbi:hypothetical protein NP493_788g00028 [Ridgeia piscesae]|uniref:tRNA-dihydrouridine(16/17) synthase [NAD(P)(+)] n=1 Tax=Ridgeia piscesae TaxID=27915 RepID=A0AAD9KQ54_RIDPI|nr:hypothetical protein NP493_788g00028 [Ridgeia piscesae]
MMDKSTNSGYEFWKTKLGGAQKIVAPMVDQSELPWRLLSRRYGAQLCYSPMFHASVFIRDANYRKDALESCPEDRPLIFCANDPETLLKAAKYAESHCDAIDLNLGCPQAIARRGHYGSFLQDDWDVLEKMVADGPRSNRQQKGPVTGLASWTHIKAVKENMRIPVFANGNIRYLDDVKTCMEQTGADGVMSAEGNLHNPALFSGQQPPVWQMAEEYLALVEQYPCPVSYVRGHLFKLFHHSLQVHKELRLKLARVKILDRFSGVVDALKAACQEDVEKYKEDPSAGVLTDMGLPYWICQPYVRPDPNEPKETKRTHETFKRALDFVTNGAEDNVLSKNKRKKLLRNPNKTFLSKPDKFEKCSCGNPKGLKCSFDLCRACCRKHVVAEMTACTAHKWYVKTKPVDEEHIKREASDICRNQVDSITDLCDVNTSNERTTSCDHSCDTPPSAAMDMCVTYNCADSRTLEHLSVQSSEEVTTPEDHNNVST